MSELDTNLLASGSARRALGALLFIGASTNVLDGTQRFAPSPYETEGLDPDQASRVLFYAHQSIGVTGFYSVAGALIARSWYPVIGWAIAAAYVLWLYRGAIARAPQTGASS